jgi:hypothetical protein
MPSTTTDGRRKLLASYHIIAKNIFPDEEARRAWLEQQTGFTSSKDLTTRELYWCVLTLSGKTPDYQLRKRAKAYTGAGSGNRITPAQARKIGAIERDLGWTPGSKQMIHFIGRQINRPCGVSMLSKTEATKVINGLIGLRNHNVKDKMRQLFENPD